MFNVLSRGVDFSNFKVSKDHPVDEEVPPGIQGLDKGELPPSKPPTQAIVPSTPLKGVEKEKSTEGKKSDLSKSQDESSSALTQQEHRAVGRVKTSIYFSYFKAWGPHLIMPAVVLGAFLLAQVAKLTNDIWLAFWTEGVQRGTASVSFYLVRIAPS